MTREMLVLILSVLSVLAITLLAAGSYFYNFSILRRKKEFLSTDPELKETISGARWDSNKEWLMQQDKDVWTMNAHDGLLLYADYLTCSKPSDKTVILVHGYSSWSGSMGGFAQYYLEELGYNVLLPDLRGHGRSEGSYIGFGWHDRRDLIQWIDLLMNKTSPDIKILLHGVSMGASTVLMASGEELPEQVKAVVSDCAYSSTKDILRYQLKRMYKLPGFPILHVTSLICRLKAGYSIGEASALKQLEKTKLPVLFIHGSADRFVPTEMVLRLYNGASCPKELLILQDAAHSTSFWKNPAEYKETLENFLKNDIY